MRREVGVIFGVNKENDTGRRIGGRLGKEWVGEERMLLECGVGVADGPFPRDADAADAADAAAIRDRRVAVEVAVEVVGEADTCNNVFGKSHRG